MKDTWLSEVTWRIQRNAHSELTQSRTLGGISRRVSWSYGRKVLLRMADSDMCQTADSSYRRSHLGALAAVLVAAHRAGARFAPVQCPPGGHKRPVPMGSSPHRVQIAQIRHQNRPKHDRPNAEPSQVPTERAKLSEVAVWTAPFVRCAHLTGSAGSRRSSRSLRR
jgi:hypothetical protein